MTNYEKIKAMSIEEMAVLLEQQGTCDFCIHYYDKTCAGCDCLNGVRMLLESEVEEDG